jgi:EAL domain-containing protein (putative c-di-GMP-specific phosphodiesterase class I)/CheY-like chemotaxis protein
MEDRQAIEAFFKSPAFGRRKIAPRVCVADAKPHIRKFLAETLEELGFVIGACEAFEKLSEILERQAPDLMVVGTSVGGMEAAEMLEVLKARAFTGNVLLLGPRDSVMAEAVQQLGEELGLAMLPMLATPFDGAALRARVASLLPAEEKPKPAIDAAEALNAGWLELWYQPIFDARTLQLSAAEALVRVRHPSWGVVPPACFLPDKNDPCLKVLSDFVVSRAIEDWHFFVSQYRAVDIAINLPISFFHDPESIGMLARRMPDHPGFDGLMIEITAADLVRDLDLAKAVARRLRFSNIAISIDDLGSEWPSLVGLEDFPFVQVKIDRQFVTGCGDDRLKRTVCRQILDLADGFGARTIAEGVQSRNDLHTVREMEFDMVQGFLLGKPMTAEKFGATSLRSSVAEPRW